MAKSTQSAGRKYAAARGREKVRSGAELEGAMEPDARRWTTNSAQVGARGVGGERGGTEHKVATGRGDG